MKTSKKLMLIPLAAGIIATSNANAQDVESYFKHKENTTFYGMSHGEISIRDNVSMLNGLPVELNSQVRLEGNFGTDIFKGQKNVLIGGLGSVNLSTKVGKYNNFLGGGVSTFGDMTKMPDGQSKTNGTVAINLAVAHFWAKENILAMLGGSFSLKTMDNSYNAFSTHKIDAVVRINGVAVATEIAIHPKDGLTGYSIYIDAKVVKFLNLMASYQMGTNRNSGPYQVGAGAEIQTNVYKKDMFFASAFIKGIKDKDSALTSNKMFDRYKGGVEVGYKFSKGFMISGKAGFMSDQDKNKGFFGGVQAKVNLYTPYTPRKMIR